MPPPLPLPLRSLVRLNPLQSLRTRLTLFAVVFLTIALSGFSAYLYSSFVSEQENAFNTALFNYATDISQGIQIDFFGSLRVDPNLNFDDGKVFPFLAGEAFLQIVDRKGNILVRSKRGGFEGLPFNKPDMLLNPSRHPEFETVELVGPKLGATADNHIRTGRYRMIYYPILRGSPNIVVLQLAVPMFLLEQQKSRLRGFLWVGIPSTILIFALLGFYLSNRALKPLQLIIRKASRMNAARMSDRLPVPPYDDELRSLSMTLNDLFIRLQNAFESQERFVSDASHQLRTPLAILRGELDVLRSKERSPQEIETFFVSASQELGHLSKMVDELLILARVDAGRDSLQFVQLRLDDLMVEAVERLDPLAKKNNLQLRLNLFDPASADDFSVRGDPDLLKTLVQNLLENAIRYSTSGNYIDVQLNSAPDSLAILVRNFGSLIPEAQIPRLFERFSRLPEAQDRNPNGVGLGLSIVKRVTEAHGGRVLVTSAETEGTAFTVTLPRN